MPTLVLDPRALGGRTGRVIDVIMADARSSAPLRVLLERRSDIGFIEDLHTSLCTEGIAAPLATDALCQVINTPSVAIRRGQRDPRRTDVLQAVAVDDRSDDGVGRMVLVVRATIIAAKPPTVEGATVDLLPVDWELLDDQCELAGQFESWWRTYELRPTSLMQPHEDAPGSCAWLGNPDGRTYREVPNGWESSVTALGAILGMRMHIAHSPREAAAQALHERADFAIVVNGTSGWESVRKNFQDHDKELLECGSPGTDFRSLLGAARQVMIPYVLGCINPTLPAAHELLPGETIYHRKVPPQPRTFDRFDTGSSIPCQHGAEGFVRWSGDKAVKGMQRRYSNFEARMLYHCSKFPTCGVYAAKG
jgi:hypothetical protein